VAPFGTRAFAPFFLKFSFITIQAAARLMPSLVNGITNSVKRTSATHSRLVNSFNHLPHLALRPRPASIAKDVTLKDANKSEVCTLIVRPCGSLSAATSALRLSVIHQFF
jgi:hypothetical protein